MRPSSRLAWIVLRRLVERRTTTSGVPSGVWSLVMGTLWQAPLTDDLSRVPRAEGA